MSAVEDSERDLKERLAGEKHRLVTLERMVTEKSVLGMASLSDSWVQIFI